MAVVPRLRPRLRAALLAGYDYEIVYGSPASLRAGPRETCLAESPITTGSTIRIERARDVLGYDPQDNSAEWDGDERDA